MRSSMRCCIERKLLNLLFRLKIRMSGRCGFVLLCSALIFCGGCGSKQARSPVELPIYFTCDTRGRLEPCGCFEGQFGGLTRLKTVLDASAPTNALRVDVGDAIAGREDYDLI